MQIFDMHNHTTKGSADSAMPPEELVREASRIGLNGVCFTEHQFGLGKDHFDRFAEDIKSSMGLLIIRAREIDSDMGHILAIGLHDHVDGIGEVRTLRKVIDNVGGVIIAAHPFRHMFTRVPSQGYPNLLFPDSSLRPKTPKDSIAHPVFELVDDIEVDNGGNTPQENDFAKDVAELLNMSGIGGSDSHLRLGVGLATTEFDGDIRNEAELIEAIKSKAFRPHGRVREEDSK